MSETITIRTSSERDIIKIVERGPQGASSGGGTGSVTSVALASSDLTITGSPITSSGTITANLANSGATAGTYTKVTVDAKGRVTSGATATAADVGAAQDIGFGLDVGGRVAARSAELWDTANDSLGLKIYDHEVELDPYCVEKFRSSLGLGTAATKDAPSTGNATSGQVVLGSDTRLTDARTPTSHSHTPSEVGLGNVTNTAQVTSVTGTAPIVSSGGTTPAISISAATTLAAGSMSAADKTKLDAISGTNTGDQTISLTGDVTGSGTGSFAATIANNAVSNAKLSQIATSTIKGRATASTGNVEDLTATQVRTLLNVSDGATANSSDATLLARANHTGTQAASTITGLAAIATSGSASDLGSGTVPTARLGSGSASTSTYLRGDSTWAAVNSFDPASPAGIGTTTPNTGAFTSLSTAPAANTSALTSTSYTLTGSNAQSLVDLAGTWNTTGTPNAIKLNITDTASNASSLLLQLQTGGVNRFTVSKGGALNAAGNITIPDGGAILEATTSSRLILAANSACRFGRLDRHHININASSDTTIGCLEWRAGNTVLFTLGAQAANDIYVRNGTSPQSFRIFNTGSSAVQFGPIVNFERANLRWQANEFIIDTDVGGTGTLRGIKIGSATSSLLGFYGATPVDQPATVADPAGGGTVDAEARTAINSIIDRLQELGLIA